MACLYPNPSELPYLWRFLTSSIIPYCHGFRAVDYFSAHSIRSFVPRHAFMRFCQSLLLAWLNLILVGCPLSLKPLHIPRIVCFLLLFLRPSLSVMEKNPIFLMFSYNWSIQLYFYLDRGPVGAHWGWSLLQVWKALSSEVSLMSLFFSAQDKHLI